PGERLPKMFASAKISLQNLFLQTAKFPGASLPAQALPLVGSAGVSFKTEQVCDLQTNK
ncbi:hypothetical protein AVEN_141222-1, partial [Araneus ventricosus]